MDRRERIERVRAGETWDLVVIGGGATGLGTAVDAASRGYRTLLLDAYDFAKGTSGRSTKLVHGGVRYLARGDIAMVREALRERGLLRNNAPHLVHSLSFVVPAYSRWSIPYYGIGLALYDVLAGGLGLGRSTPISRAEAIRRVPTLEPDGLRGGVAYFDGQFDDARLAIALMRTLETLGGTALNYMPITALLKSDGRIAGVRARDSETGEEFSIAARGVVNATGVYADAIRRLDDSEAGPMVTPSQGAHLVLGRSFLPGASAVMVPRTDDGRVLFAIPWHDRTIVGTTDTPVDSSPIEPRPLRQEVEFLLTHAGRYLRPGPSPSDVLSVYAGLRPLLSAKGGTRTARLSRGHAVLVSSSGLVTVTGGKWTTYRRMGELAVDRAARVAGLSPRPCVTPSLRLHGWEGGSAPGPFSGYGSDTPALLRTLAENPDWDEPLHPDLPYRAGEVVWAARHESARTVEDILARRTRALILDARASREVAPRVANLLAGELGRDAAWQADQVRQFRDLASGYLIAGH